MKIDLRKPAPIVRVNLDQMPANPPFPALNLLERTTPPLRFGRPPVWKLSSLDALDSAEVFVPSWSWYTVKDVPDGTDIVTLTTNGALLSAIGHTWIAHSDLNHTGPWHGHPDPYQVPPGYYRITVPHWVFAGTIVSPLGDSSRLETEDTVWVAAPTLALLVRLAADGYLGALTILDSYTAAERTTFQCWAQRLRSVRLEALDQIDAAHPSGLKPADCDCPPCTRYTNLETSITDAVAALAAGTPAGTHRPDWAHTLYAAYAQQQWCKAWRYSFTGYPLVGMPSIDELQVIREQLSKAQQLPTKPLLFDETGRSVAAVRITHIGTLAENLRLAPVADDDQEQGERA